MAPELLNLQTPLLFAALYSLGGRSEVSLAIRRYVGWGLFVAFATLYNYQSAWQFLFYAPLLLALHLPYGGGSDLNDKILKRLLVGFVAGLTGLGLGFFLGSPHYGLIQGGLAMLGSLVFGAFGLVRQLAWLEEFLIALCYVVVISYM